MMQVFYIYVFTKGTLESLERLQFHYDRNGYLI